MCTTWSIEFTLLVEWMNHHHRLFLFRATILLRACSSQAAWINQKICIAVCQQPVRIHWFAYFHFKNTLPHWVVAVLEHLFWEVSTEMTALWWVVIGSFWWFSNTPAAWLEWDVKEEAEVEQRKQKLGLQWFNWKNVSALFPPATKSVIFTTIVLRKQELLGNIHVHPSWVSDDHMSGKFSSSVWVHLCVLGTIWCTILIQTNLGEPQKRCLKEQIKGSETNCCKCLDSTVLG